MEESAADPFRVIIADDDGIARHAVKHVLQSAGITVVAEVATGRDAVELASHYLPEVVLMDVVMPDIDGLEATRRIRRQAPSVHIVLLTSSMDAELPFVGLQTGAVGFVRKDAPLDALPAALRGVTKGEAVLSRSLTGQLVEQYRVLSDQVASMRPVRSVLTGREWEVLDLLCIGTSTDDIATELFLERATVRSHIKNILRKLGVSSRAEAVTVAQSMRLQVPAA
jgi:NarL family two-component system response regulator LiaR